MVVCTLCRRLNVYRSRLLQSLLFIIQRKSSSMTRKDQRGHLLFSSKTQRLSIETTLVSIFAIQRQSSPIARRDEYGHMPPPFFEDSMSFDRSCYNSPFCYLEATKSDGMRRPWWSLAFIVPRLSKSHFPSKDKRVLWYVGTMMVIHF